MGFLSRLLGVGTCGKDHGASRRSRENRERIDGLLHRIREASHDFPASTLDAATSRISLISAQIIQRQRETRKS